MKREELKAKGLADADIDYILDAWHNEQKNLLGQVQTLTKERDDARAETKKYQKDGEFYIDPAEHKRLKTFDAFFILHLFPVCLPKFRMQFL